MPERTALLRRQALGDVVLLGAVTGSLADVTVVTHARWVEVASRLKGVAHAEPWPDTARRLDVDRVVDLQSDARSLALSAVQSVPVRRIRKRPVLRRLKVYWGLGPGRPTVPDLYAEAAGVPVARRPWIDLPVVPKDALLVAPGSSWAPKRWAPERFAAVARSWRGPVVVVGSAGERDLVRRVADDVPGAEARAEDGFASAWDWLGRCRVALTNDSGWMHLAGASGVPVVALFGPTSPADGFAVHPGLVVERSVGCRPCALHRVARCHTGTLACQDHAVDDVIAAVHLCAAS
jgi:heptosyltransferase-2